MKNDVMEWVNFILIVISCIQARNLDTVSPTQTSGNLNTETGESTCFVKTQSELSSIRKNLLVSSFVNLEVLGRTLHKLILNLQKSNIKKTEDGFTFPCEIIELCEEYYTLEALLDQELSSALKYKTDFNAMWMEKNHQLKIKDKSEFSAFQVGNTYIKLLNNSISSLILYEKGAQRILSNDLKGNCKCPESPNLNTLFEQQQNLRSTLLHNIRDFEAITETL